MPLYEYECDNCGHRFEVIQKFSDSPITECPKCQGSVHKLFSSPAIQFKGSGWYITDYAKKSGTAAGSSKSEGSGDKSEKSGDSASGSSSSGDGGAKADTATKTTTPSS
ncbi:FmdB family zinc ribbon protein [Luteitalea sp.]|jgi:putative FmdB family regulatory protein|uniref:FmdB family zinc ribbon protein n=1 Tax=Luteitalea sp. TaxID=2004800 RepID=UPI000AAADF05|nr:FmdB family zinc ribbon protein [Luteitalea sp.]